MLLRRAVQVGEEERVRGQVSRGKSGGGPSSSSAADASSRHSAPGKTTLVQQLASPADAGSDLKADEGAPSTVQAAAARGIAGSSGTLPHAQTIQRLFGRHDVSNIVAHTDEAASQGAQAMSAQAYATGQHVAFASTPDLHTAAHEAAHVIQQRGGVHMKGGVGDSNDVHEQHANAVADRVVSGRSAEDLLDRYASGNRGPATTTLTAPVQRQAVGSATPATASSSQAGNGATPARTPVPAQPEAANTTDHDPAEAYHAPTSARNPHAPPARNATWPQVQSAGAEGSAQAELDIEWIDTLPRHLQDSIDQGFSDAAQKKQVASAKRKDAGMAAIEKDHKRTLEELKAATLSRLIAADPKVARMRGRALEKLLDGDRTFASEKALLHRERRLRDEQRKRELEAAADGPRDAGSRKDTVVPPPARITRSEGKTLARTNFMSWAVDLLGSTQAAKQHFLSIREVSRQPGMFLTATAAARFEAARAEFEARHPGYTFPSTDTAQHLRGFHQARQGIGMLGHALGVAFDLFAYDNPNQKLGDTENYGYLLNRFGGQGDQRGRSIMTLGAGGEAAVAQLGKDTAANRSTPAGQALLARIHDQFEEMVATSRRLQASMATHLDELSQARDDYFNAKELSRALAKATLDEKNAVNIANKQMKQEKFHGDAAEKAARREEIKHELSLRRRQLKESVQGMQASARAALQRGFADWIATINADIAAVTTRKTASDAELASRAQARSELEAIDPRAPGAAELLNEFAARYQLNRPGRLPPPTTYKRLIMSQLAAKQRARAKTDPMSPEHIRAELASLKAWLSRLTNPEAVFGEGEVVPRPAPRAASPSGQPSSTTSSAAQAPEATTSRQASPGPAETATSPAPAGKHWATKTRVSEAPVMQFLEHGFIRSDEMPERSPGLGKKEVFNAEVATTLARHGFSPGATFRDTMHFDFIEGYGAAPGGRGMSNMNKNKYGPSGDLVPSAPKSPAASKGRRG